METIHKSIDIKSSVDRVFAYVQDPHKQMEWMTSLTDVRNVSGDRKNLHYEWTYKMAGIPFDGESQRTEYVGNERIVSKSTGGIDATFTFAFTPKDAGTHVDLTIDYEIPVPVLGKLAEKLIAGRNARETDLNLQNIKEHCES